MTCLSACRKIFDFAMAHAGYALACTTHRAAGTARMRSAAAVMLTYSVLRTASAPCAGRIGAFTCILEEWGPPGWPLPRAPSWATASDGI